MFLVHRPDVRPTGAVPTVLNGYGGFNISRTPQYIAGAAAWVEAGGLFALPNLRGGGEYGERWHRAGMLERKQNVFDDFHAAAEALIARGWTNPEHIGVAGGSNGGLLTGAALTQRPDLFGAVYCAVPLLDMLRYQNFLIARFWIAEYGSAEDAEQYRWLREYSPYHHVREGIRYPAVLFTTAEGDSRVDPMHARKMAALLQAQSAEDPDATVLLRVDRDAGHGSRASRSTSRWTILPTSIRSSRGGWALRRRARVCSNDGEHPSAPSRAGEGIRLQCLRRQPRTLRDPPPRPTRSGMDRSRDLLAMRDPIQAAGLR